MRDLNIIIGLGKTGLAFAHFLQSRGQNFVVMDTRTDPPGWQEFQSLYPDAPCYLGELSEQVLQQARIIYLSPGFPLQHPLLQIQQQQGVEILGDIEVFAQQAQAPICAITGSNAKSTVTSLVGAMAKDAGLNVRVGGNIGIPALALLADEEPDLYVLELSSFQLETVHSLQPKVATILNISPDHMDRYPDLNSYIGAKQRIYQGAQQIVVNREDKNTFPAEGNSAERISFGLDTPPHQNWGLLTTPEGTFLAHGTEMVLPVQQMAMKGQHNWANALAALALGSALGFPLSSMLHTLRHFSGLPHRCQWVAELNGVHWYNDSKGTNVGATLAAVKGLASAISGRIILLAGGLGKDADFSPLQSLAPYLRTAILFGTDAPQIGAVFKNLVPCRMVQSMEEAVHAAHQAALPQDAVLLSPACASFDMFQNFEHRGDVFMEDVLRLAHA